MNLFDHLNNLCKVNGCANALDDPKALASYNPFLINRALANQLNLLPIVAEVNKLGIVDKKMHFDFLFTVIPKKDRFVKWTKKSPENEEVEAVRQAYQCNEYVAVDYIKALKPEEIKVLVDNYKAVNERNKQNGTETP